MSRYVRRPADAWRLVVRAGSSLTVPRIDPERDDPAVGELMAGSVFGRIYAAVLSTLTVAWRTSALRTAAADVAAVLAPLDGPGRVRCTGVVVVVAAIVVLTGRFAQASPGRFTWVLPAAAAIAGWLMAAMAVPIALALQDRRR